MKRFLFLGLLLLWSVSMRAQTNQVGVFKMLVDVVDARTIADNGGGTAATLTLTPRGSFVTITCNDTDGCAITLGETGVRSGQQLRLFNLSANAVTLADSAGVQELQSSVSLAQYASIDCEYLTDRWSCGGSGGGSGTVTTTGSPASGNLAFFSGASSITNGNLSGDVTTSGTGAATIANDAVSNAKLRNSGALSVIGRSANSSGDPADISCSAGADGVLRESGSTLGCGTIATGGLANDAVTFAKIQNSSAASVLVGRGSASGAGDFQEITLGSGFSMSGTTLSAPGTGNGVVVQVKNTQTGAVSTGSTTIPADDTIPQNTEGTEFMTLAITPTSATNKLRIDVVIYLASDTNGEYMTAALFQDTTANALAAGVTYLNNQPEPRAITFTHYMTAGTTSATTFKMRAGGHSASTTTFNGSAGARLYGGVLASSITIAEIVP